MIIALRLDLRELQACNSPLEGFFHQGKGPKLVRRIGMPIRPEANPQAGITTGPTIKLESGESIELSWQERALCAQTDPEAFFPEKGGSTREAKRVCLSCDVRSQCLEYALAHDERFGIWGGLSERERRRLKRRSA